MNAEELDRRAFNAVRDGAPFVVSGLPGSGRSTFLKLLADRWRSERPVATSVAQFRALSDGDAKTAVLVVDDADTVDGDDQLFVAALLARGGTPLIAAVSSWTQHADVVSPVVDVVRNIPLYGVAPLDEQTSRSVARAAAHSSLVIDDVSGAAGNPGLLLAVARATPPLEVAAISELPATGVVPSSSVPMLGVFDDEMREFLHVVSLCDPVVSLHAVAIGVGLPHQEVLKRLSALGRVGVLDGSGDYWKFRQPWLAHILRSERPRAEVRARHSLIAQGLLVHTADADQVAHHLLASGDRTPAVVGWMLDEAEARISEQPASSVRLLESLVAGSPPRFPGVDRARSVLARAYAVTGRASDLERLIAQTIGDGSQEEETNSLFVFLGEALLRDDAVKRAVEVLESHDVTPDDHRAPADPQVLAMRSLHRVLSGDLDSSEREALEAQRMGRERGDDLSVSVSSSALAHVSYYRGFLPEAAEYAATAVAHANKTGSDEVRRRARYEYGMFLAHADEVESARRVFTEELERVDRLTDAWYRPLPHVGLGLLDYQCGEWDRATSHLRDAIRFGEEVSTRWESWAARAHLAIIAIERGELGVAARHLDEIDEDSANSPHHCLDLVLWARGLLQEALGQFEEGFALVNRAAGLVMEYGVISRFRWLAPDLVRLARRVDRRDECSTPALLLDTVAQRSQRDHVWGAALRTRALLEDNADMALRAVDTLDGAQRPVEHALAKLDAARLMTSDATAALEASRLYSEARATFERLGAAGRVLALRAEVRASGLPPLSESRRRTTRAPGKLTPTEERIAELAAQGLSNPEIAELLFISRRTVEAHLSHIFSKLGVKSRVALTVRAFDRPMG